jgi:O-antigen ligase
MDYMVENFKKFNADPLNVIAVLLFFSTALFLTLKGAVTTASFLVFFVCTFQIAKSPRYYLFNRGSQFWTIVICLLSPFLAELFAQVGRWSFIGSSLDGPSRAILATSIFIYLSTKDCAKLLSAISLGSAVGIILVFLCLHIFPEYYWANRAATYFVDPITLPCYTVALLGIVLFGDQINIRAIDGNFIKLVLCVLALYIAIESQSRSSWVAGVFLAEVYVIHSFRASVTRILFGTLMLLVGIFVVFYFSDIFRERSLEAMVGLSAFFNLDRGSWFSSYQRIVLLLIDYELIKNNFLFGVADGVMPNFEYLQSIIPSITKEIYEIRTLAGSHSELVGQVVRKGVFLGAFALWGLFGYPIYLIVREYRKQGSLGCELEKLLGLVVPVLISGLTIQVFNLKMTISFYILLLAVFLACYNRGVYLRRINLS